MAVIKFYLVMDSLYRRQRMGSQTGDKSVMSPACTFLLINGSTREALRADRILPNTQLYLPAKGIRLESQQFNKDRGPWCEFDFLCGSWWLLSMLRAS